MKSSVVEGPAVVITVALAVAFAIVLSKHAVGCTLEVGGLNVVPVLA
jgi:hypothetical protein